MTTTAKKAAIISLVAETHIHPGVGQSTGALDLPVSRERTTHYPFVPGSSVKGAMRVWAIEKAGLDTDVNSLFGAGGDDSGADDGAGNLLCSDARLLLLPVRCLSDAFKWVTCPAILKRFARDCARAGLPTPDLNIEVQNGSYLGVDTREDMLGLEEREFKLASGDTAEIVAALGKIVDETDIKNRLVILHDDDFTWFARYALPVMARNKLEDDTKRSLNLWYEETLAPDTIMYLLLGERKDDAVGKVTIAIKDDKAKYIQIGGNETVGQGWFAMAEYGGEGA